ncbi:hypothetical protein AAMO2058_001572600 [Amorphochlora amoebiformis]
MKACGKCNRKAKWNCLHCKKAYCDKCYDLYHNRTSRKKRHTREAANVCEVCRRSKIVLKCLQCGQYSCRKCWELRHKQPSLMFHEYKMLTSNSSDESRRPEMPSLPKLGVRPLSAPIKSRSTNIRMRGRVGLDTPKHPNTSVIKRPHTRYPPSPRNQHVKSHGLLGVHSETQPELRSVGGSQGLSGIQSYRHSRRSKTIVDEFLIHSARLPPIGSKLKSPRHGRSPSDNFTGRRDTSRETGRNLLIPNNFFNKRTPSSPPLPPSATSRGPTSPLSPFDRSPLDKSPIPKYRRNVLGLKLNGPQIDSVERVVLDALSPRSPTDSGPNPLDSSDKKISSSSRRRKPYISIRVPGSANSSRNKLSLRLGTPSMEDQDDKKNVDTPSSRRSRMAQRLQFASPNGSLGSPHKSPQSPKNVGKKFSKAARKALADKESNNKVEASKGIEESKGALEASYGQRPALEASYGQRGALEASYGQNKFIEASRSSGDSINNSATWKITQGEFRKGNFSIGLKGVRKIKDAAKTPLHKAMSNEQNQPKRTLEPSDMVKLGHLGTGCSASVIKAMNKRTFQIMALKVINVFDRNKRNMLVKELEAFEIAQQERVPYIVEYHGAYFAEGSTTLALEYMNQGSLESIIKKFKMLKESVIKSTIKQALLGLKFLEEKRMMHRDIKPANILVNHRGQVKLADFGILGILTSSMELAKTMVGTKRYMSPERIKSERYGYNADVWSLGLVAMEMALGDFPIKMNVNDGYFAIMTAICENPFKELDKKMFSDIFAKFCKLCVLRDPSQRPGSTGLLLHEFVRDIPADKCCVDWPFLIKEVGSESQGKTAAEQNQDRWKDLENIAKIFANQQIQQQEYKRSWYNQAVFKNLGYQLGFSSEDVRNCCEQTILKAAAASEKSDAS